MTCVRENYDRFLLILIAITLLACSALFVHATRQLGNTLNQFSTTVSQSVKFPVVGLEKLKQGIAALAEPSTWSARMVDGYRLPLFASVPMGTHVDYPCPFDGLSIAPLYPPVPNDWLISNKQDLLSDNVLEQDSDGDGFTTLDEYLGKTDPMNMDSHPPYWTKLTFAKLIHVPFWGRGTRTSTTYAVLNYTWTGKPFAVKEGQEFGLTPEDNVKYRCVDVSPTSVHLVKKDARQDIYLKLKAGTGR